eukprot:m.461321 g.461321  ORF g.461321 m.461321 type:complete len:546 (-) comp22275_c0_seq1:65-1702(-)
MSVPRSKDGGVNAALQAQAMARANAEQQQQYVKELLAWEKKVKVKDESLKQTKSIGQALPPVRNSESPKKPPQPAKSSDGGGKRVRKEKPIPGGDFRAWDKFDVDKALADVDEADAAEAGADEEAAAHRAQLMREHKAKEEKDRGNEQFKLGKYAAAIECYSRGIDIDPASSVLFANRAMARLKMKQYIEAEQDCTMAIELAPTYIKPWQRRATARAALQRLEEAFQDYKMVLRLDPDDKVAKREVKTLPQRIANAKEKARLAFRPLEHAGDSTQLSTAKSEQTLHRITIEEIGGSDSEEDDGVNSETAHSFTQSEVQSETTHPQPESTLQAELHQPPPARSPTARKIQIIEDDGSDSDDEASALTTTKPPAPVQSPTASSSAIASDTKSTQHQTTQKTQLKSAAKPAAAKPANKRSPRRVSTGATPGTKMTSVKFESTWRRCDAAGMLALLQSIEPRQLPGLIKHNLCAELMAIIFAALNLSSSTGALDELEVLESLAKTQRFDQTLMFLDDKELKLLRTVMSAVRERTNDRDRADQVESTYQL